MKKFFALFAACAALALVACAAGAPEANEVQQIQAACAVDAGLRPTVTALMAVPGLVQPADDAAIVAARAVIDPICANPAGTPQANAISILVGANAQLVGIVTQIQARKMAAEYPAATASTPK